MKRFCDRVSDCGYTVLAPDLNFGSVFEDVDDARDHLADANADRLAGLTLASAKLLREKTVDPSLPIAVVGFSMGASLGLWASVRLPEEICAVAAFYGTQNIDFSGNKSAYQLHLAEVDEWVGGDDAAFMEATIGLSGAPVEVHRYPGTEHWFFEQGVDAYDADAAATAWMRLEVFLERLIG